LWKGCGEYPSTHPPEKRIFTNLDQAPNLSGIINQLGGTVDINCSTSGGTTSCQFLQDTIKSVFGSTGLQMSGCTFGECVRQNVIDFVVSGGTNSSSTNTSSEGTHLSGGVIAGLAVVGGLVLVGFLLLLWGFITQRRARQDTTAVPRTGGVTVEWKNIDYSIPPSNGALFTKSKTRDGKVILHNLSGIVRPGEMLTVLGPSGEHRFCFSLVPL
jgi:ABC-type multidrug transport system fused ATPase/permease subunit